MEDIKKTDLTESDFDQALQEFTYRASLISGLQKGGKLSTEEAFKKIRKQWRELKKHNPRLSA